MAKGTLLGAIRKKCLDCMCGQAYEVRMCPSEDCSLWEYRFGNNPQRSKKDVKKQK